MTWIFFSPAAFRTTSNVSLGASFSAGAAPPPPPPAITTPPAAGSMPCFSFRYVFSSTACLSVRPASWSPIVSLVASAMIITPGRVVSQRVEFIPPQEPASHRSDLTRIRGNRDRRISSQGNFELSSRGGRRRFAAGLLGLLLDRLHQRRQRGRRPGQRARQARPGSEDRRQDPCDRFLARGHLAGGLNALLPGVNLAVEEHAAQLQLVVGLLLFQQQPRNCRHALLAVHQSAGAFKQALKALELRALQRLASQRVAHHRHLQLVVPKLA